MTARDSLDHFIGWAKANASPIDLDADLDSFADLEPFKTIVGDARVVGFGESQHYIGEFNRFRSRLFRYLVEEMNFTTFVFECGVPESKGAYDYVLGAHDNADDAYLSISSSFGMWRDIQDTLDWMRDHNRDVQDTRKLRFYGMDGSQSWSHAGKAVAFVCDYLEQIDPGAAGRFRSELLPLAESIRIGEIGEAAAESLRDLTCGLAALVAHLLVEQMHFVKRSGFEAFDWAQRAALIAQQIGTMLAAAQADRENAMRVWWNIRDACMALQLRWILDREGPEARLVVGAHNIHLQRTFARESAFVQTTMGQHLTAALPDGEMVIIAATNDYSLKPDDPAIEGSFQAALAEVGMPAFVLDLRPGAGDERVAAWLDQERPDRSNIMFQQVNTAKAWDAVWFSERIRLDALGMPKPLVRQIVTLDPDRLAGLAGVYDMLSVVDERVVLKVASEGGRLLTDGADSDGELFPMHQSELHALSDSMFCWSEWPMLVEFERGEDGVASGLRIGSPLSPEKYHGKRRGSGQAETSF